GRFLRANQAFQRREDIPRRGRVERVSKRFERFAQAFKGGIRGHKTRVLRKSDAVRRFRGGGAFANPAVLPKLVVHLFSFRLGQHQPHQFMHNLCRFDLIRVTNDLMNLNKA
ncbi:MAG TPA: hypothetical protein VGH55_05900, partial [Chthoniobacterales bacterium]